MSNNAFKAGAIIDFKDDGKGNFTVKQVHEQLALPKVVELRAGDRKEIVFDVGPIHIKGYVVISTLEIGVEVSIFGIKLGDFYGSLKRGIYITLELFLASGTIRFYLKDKDVWVHYDVKVIFDGEFKNDIKLLDL